MRAVFDGLCELPLGNAQLSLRKSDSKTTCFDEHAALTLETEPSLSRVTVQREVCVHVVEEHDVVCGAAPFHVGRLADVEMRVAEIPEGIQLTEEFSLRRNEHQIHWKVPLSDKRFGQGILLFSERFQIVDDDESTDKRPVDAFDDNGRGEQTCSRIGATWSTALVIQPAP